MRSYYQGIIILVSSLLLIAAKAPQSQHFAITGIHKKEKTNVEHRLADLYTQAGKNDISEETLKEQVKKALMPYGFFEPTISVILPSKKHAGKVHVIPGPQMIISQLAIQISGPGRDNCEVVHAYKNLPIKQGDGFNSILYEEAKNKLISAAENQGYLNTTFEKAYVYIDERSNKASIVLHFDTGKRSYFGRVTFKTGNPQPTPPAKGIPRFPRLSRIMQALSPKGHDGGLFSSKKITLSNELLNRYIPFNFGCPYSNDEIMKLDSNLKASGYFKSVNVTPANENSGSVPLDVYLEPIERFRYSVSGGYGTDTGIRGRLGLHVIPVNTKGHKLDFVGQGSSYQNAAQIKYTIPGLDPVHNQYNVNGGFNNLNYVSGNSRSGRISLVKEYTTLKFQSNLSINGLHENFRYSKQPRNESTVFYPKVSLTWREVSDPLFSPSGFNITVNGLASSRAILSKINLSELMLDIKGAITIDLIRTRFYGHVIQGITQTSDIYSVPLSLAQLLGGPENMRGFSFNSIGPGKILSYGGIEIQKETIDTWYVIGFIDKGTVFRPDPKLVQYDIGIGLMWRSPVGPIKAAIAHPTNSRLNPLKDKGVRFVVNMGPDI
ncbi:MAG: BamA/TamA family outer membrane protein [Legionellaceae bacterium]|nr:BamA/TamA family outer membrane protein [Legionellaceae bacterium]